MSGRNIISLVGQRQDIDHFRRKNWTGTFEEYLDIVRETPQCTRNAFERVYDMILSYGTATYEEMPRKASRIISFFDDPDNDGADAVFGLDRAIESLVNAFKSAAKGYGIEKRVLLLHGPVGSSKSTIARLLKKGLERYSDSRRGSAVTRWVGMSTARRRAMVPDARGASAPVPEQFRSEVEQRVECRIGTADDFPGPNSRRSLPLLPIMNTRNDCKKYDGDWTKVIDDVRVKRIILSEKDRIGIGTFQPKDEKNQDSTELTGDINYRKIAEYGSDSDPRAFNFDGEFNIANRGHHRIRRSAQARRGFSLRPAGGQPGTQGQAQEVRPDRHRRSHSGAHERT